MEFVQDMQRIGAQSDGTFEARQQREEGREVRAAEPKPRMTGFEHFRRAEELLAEAADVYDSTLTLGLTTAAQAHATLALAYATAERARIAADMRRAHGHSEEAPAKREVTAADLVGDAL